MIIIPPFISSTYAVTEGTVSEYHTYIKGYMACDAGKLDVNSG